MSEDVKLVDRAMSWLGAYGDADDLATARDTWKVFEANPPTATVFGAYDSGKSSLLRRLLVDADIPVPEWLTISARQETFEASAITYRDIILKDTPGVSPGSTDARGESHTATALEAIRTTDVLVVVVTSQLLTAERALVATALDLPWSEGALWFVISRFDEAGVDPDGDQDGYRQLAECKRRELAEQLQRTLGRDLKPRVFVASPDPYGVVGSDQDPDPTLWDPFRQWDGIEEIATQLASLHPAAVALRAAAAKRFWIGEVRDQLATLLAQEAEVDNVARTTSDLYARVDQLSARLNELRVSAHNDLNTAVGAVVDQAMTSSVLTEEGLKTRLTEALELWLERQGAELAALAQDMEHQLEQQVARPSWQGLKRLIEQLSVHLPTDDTTRDSEGINLGDYKKPLLELNKDLAKTTTDLKAIFETKSKGARQSAAESSAEKLSKAGKLFKSVDAATKIVPFALDLLDLTSQINNDAKEAKAKVQRRAEIDGQLEAIKDRAVAESYGAFQSECDKLSAVLNELKTSIDAVANSLDERREFSDSARAEAATLLQFR
ncbi:GTPase [Tessaracoccus rhinocerotis]|nr:GTPase [Tessaracoccus rhinocerotis]